MAANAHLRLIAPTTEEQTVAVRLQARFSRDDRITTR